MFSWFGIEGLMKNRMPHTPAPATKIKQQDRKVKSNAKIMINLICSTFLGFIANYDIQQATRTVKQLGEIFLLQHLFSHELPIHFPMVSPCFPFNVSFITFSHGFPLVSRDFPISHTSPISWADTEPHRRCWHLHRVRFPQLWVLPSFMQQQQQVLVSWGYSGFTIQSGDLKLKLGVAATKHLPI